MVEYISREAAENLFYTVDPENDGSDGGTIILMPGTYNSAEIEAMLENLPAADVEPVRHGEWIEDHDYLKCPECSVMVKRDFTFFDIGNWNYCPNCGAKMDGGADNG